MLSNLCFQRLQAGHFSVCPIKGLRSVGHRPPGLWEGMMQMRGNTHQISLQVKPLFGTRYHTCGGTLISDTVVVCAAHCVKGQTLSQLTVVVGALRLKSGGFLFCGHLIFYLTYLIWMFRVQINLRLEYR